MNDRFIGIDFGLSKVGLSISDPLKIISIPLKVIKYKNRKELLSKLQEIALENDVKSFVVGYPLNMNNKKNEMTKLVDDLFVELKNLNFNVFLQDERLSSESAKKIMREQNIKTGNNKEYIDLIASTIILQSFLDKGVINE
jgi:putative Holliday junction resolvase